MVLVAWRTGERLDADVERQPRQWLSVGLGEFKGDGCAVGHYPFCLEGKEAEAVLGIKMEDFPARPVPVELKLIIKEQ